MRRFVTVLSAAVLAATAVGCGGSDGDAGDTEAFCAALENNDEYDLDEDFEGGMAALRELESIAPDEIRDDLGFLIGKFEEIEEIDAATGEDAEDAFAAMFAIALDPEVIAASEALETFARDECGLDLDDSGTVDVETDLGADTVLEADAGGTDIPVVTEDREVPDGWITEAADVEDPLWDPGAFDDPIDPDEPSLDGLKYHVDTTAGDAPWRTSLYSWTQFGDSWSVGGIDLSDAEALEVCDVVLDYMASLDLDGDVTVTTAADFADDETESVMGDPAAGCSVVG